MVQITVGDDVARQIASAVLPIVLVDSHGRALGQLGPPTSCPAAEDVMSDDEWAEIKRQMASDDGSRFSWAEVREHLRSLAPQ